MQYYYYYYIGTRSDKEQRPILFIIIFKKNCFFLLFEIIKIIFLLTKCNTCIEDIRSVSVLVLCRVEFICLFAQVHARYR